MDSSGGNRFTAGHPKVGGRRKGTKNQLTTDFTAALCADFRKHGQSVIASVREEYPADYVKLLALLVAKWGENADAAGVITQVSVITGVRGPGPYECLPPPRPLLPDGRDPFEEHGQPLGHDGGMPVSAAKSTHAGGSSIRPMGIPPVTEPPQHKLFEGPPDIPSDGRD